MFSRAKAEDVIAKAANKVAKSFDILFSPKVMS
jgi:hypothetical protein